MIDLTIYEFMLVTYILWTISVFSFSTYIHRYITHNSLIISDALINFCKVNLWLYIPSWPADGFESWRVRHITHHIYSDGPGDPHSPYYKSEWDTYNISHVELPKSNINITELDNTLTKISYYVNGRYVLLFALMLMFGWYGILMTAILLSIPTVVVRFVISYISHIVGYNNEFTAHKTDHSRNLIPLGVFCGGEELHGNHHRHSNSPNFAIKWYEIDITFCMIYVLSLFGVVKFHKK